MAMESKSYTLQHLDGSEVTAQEVYDAFMSGLVLLDAGMGDYPIPLYIIWRDTNKSYIDTTSVGVVAIAIAYYHGDDTAISIVVGDSSLIEGGSR